MSSNRVLLQGFPTRLNKRGISEATCQKYKIHKDSDRLRFYYHSADGVIVGCKTKTKDKDFKYEGQTDGTFFGQHLWPSNGKMVVITEGELDAASVYQVLRTWPVVSLPSGAAGAKKSIKKNLEWLQGYTKVVLLFDDDEAGRSAAKEAASVLSPGKVFIGFVEGYKDASDALQADDLKAITRAVWDAKPYRPDGIVDGKSLLDLVTTPNPPNDYDYPYRPQPSTQWCPIWRACHHYCRIWHRKSSFCRELATHFYKMEDGSVTWLLKNQTDVLLWA